MVAAVLDPSGTQLLLEAAEARWKFLAEASSVLASSLDYEQTLANVARLLVPALGDHCVVDVFDAGGVAQRVAEAVSERPPPPHFNVLSLPLCVHGRVLGTLRITSSVERRSYTTDELRLADEIALRAALAIEHARLYRDAREAVRTRDEFMLIASHELRTPLNVMLLQADGLLRQAHKENDTRLFSPLERIKRQVGRLGALVESLLDVSRITAGRLSLDVGDVELGSVVAEVVARLHDDAVRSGSTMKVAATREITGKWDRLRIDQIVTNLLSNAIKYGGGKPIEVEIGVDGDRAKLRVTDHGIGIGEEHQTRIFERFERAVSSRHYGGFGLGLWIVRQVMQAHGGDISIRSRVGEGSTFIAELPLAGPPPKVSAPKPDSDGCEESRAAT
jgi:signal transduction histidine kinase